MMYLASLTLPNFQVPFNNTIYASKLAIDVLLSQNDYPTSFYDKKMCPCMQVASTYHYKEKDITGDKSRQ